LGLKSLHNNINHDEVKSPLAGISMQRVPITAIN
jgi:hypothetical protein